jgi:hypothetical protein
MWTPLLAECWTNSVGPLSIITLIAPKWRLNSILAVFATKVLLMMTLLGGRILTCWDILYLLNKKLKPAFLGFLKWMPVLNGPVQSKSTVKELIIGLKRFYDDLWLLYTFIQPRTYIGFCMCKIFLRCVIFTMQISIYSKLCCTYIKKKQKKQKGCVIFQSVFFVFRKKKIPTVLRQNISFGSVRLCK